METYDIYEVYYHGKINELDLTDGFDIYYFVTDIGDWDLVDSYTNKEEADKAWDKWAKNSSTEIDEDDKDFFASTVFVYEKSIRNAINEVMESQEIDGAVEVIN